MEPQNELERLLAQLEGQISDADRNEMIKYYNLVKNRFAAMTDKQLGPFAKASRLDYKNQLKEYKNDYVPRHGPDSGEKLGQVIEKWCENSKFDLNPYEEDDEYMMWAFEGAVFDVLTSRKL